MDRTLYIFNSLSDPGSGISAQRAIEYGKDIAAKLREIAEYDVNKKYILWKVNELESHIYLEENGLLMEKEQWKQKNINELVKGYNVELGKKRPSFSRLASFFSQMSALDQSSAKQMEKSIKSRANALAGEVPHELEEALQSKSYETAREDIAWCESNREYLKISTSRIAELQAKVFTDISLDRERVILKGDFDSLEASLLKNLLPEGRNRAALIKNRLDGLKNRMMALEWSRLNNEQLRFSGKIGNKEDSLVNKDIGLLKSEGIVAAEMFFDTLRATGVSEEKSQKSTD